MARHTSPIVSWTARSSAAHLAAAALMLTGGFPLSAQTSVGDGHVFDGGAIVSAEAAGVAFTIPSGWQAQWDASAGLFVMSGDGARAAVWAYSSGTPDEMAEVIGADLEELGVVVGEDQVERPDADRIYGTFEALSDAGRGRLVGSILRGPHGAVIGAAALGGPGTDDALRAAVDAVISSVRWRAPLAAEWEQRLAGTTVRGGSTNSDYSPDELGGNLHLSSAGRDDVTIVLCRDRSYEYSSESVFHVSTPDVSVASEDSDSHAGTWRLVGDVAGNAILVLAPWDRDPVVYDVEEGTDGVLIDGRSYEASAAGC